MNVKIYLGLLLLSLLPHVGAQTPGQDVETPDYIKEFSNLPKNDRERYGLHKSKAEQFFRQKRTFECLEEIHLAAKIFDKDPAIWNVQGASFVEMRQFKKARESYEKALAIEPSSNGVLFNLAEMDFVTKRWDDCSEKMSALMKQISAAAEGPLEGPTLALHHLALFKQVLSEYKMGNQEKARKLAEANWDDFDDTPFTYYSKAAFDFLDGQEEEGNAWMMSAVRVFGGIENVANWHDTMIEVGLVKSFYGGEEAPAASR